MKKILSFIIPCYNGANTIEKCLNSIYEIQLAEDDFEVICVNDCSPDNMFDLVIEFSKLHTNLKILNNNQNLKQGGAKNTGIRHAEGVYLAFVDQDDIVNYTHFGDIKQILESNNPDILSFRYLEELQDGKLVEQGIKLQTESEVLSSHLFIEKYFNPAYSLAPWAYFYKNEFWKKNHFAFAEKVFWEDADLIAQCLYYANTIKFIPRPLYTWCYNNESISRTVSANKIADRIIQGNRKLSFAKKIANESPLFSKKIYDDGIWNATAVRRIVSMKYTERQVFYRLLEDNEFDEIKRLVKPNYLRYLYQNTIPIKISLFILFPVLRALRFLNIR